MNPLARAYPSFILQLLLHKIIVSSSELLSQPEIIWLKNDLIFRLQILSPLEGAGGGLNKYSFKINFIYSKQPLIKKYLTFKTLCDQAN
jgi:hypothetical protein